MKIALVLVVGFLAVVAVSADGYTTKWDKINIDGILENDRLRENYVNCLMEKGNCTPDGKELQISLPDALRNDCKKCSAKQKEGARKVIKYLREHQTATWAELKAKYDPENKYEALHPDFQ